MRIGKHCIKIWITTQGAVALNSAESEFYAFVAALLRARSLVLAKDLGCMDLRVEVKEATDSFGSEEFCESKRSGEGEAQLDQYVVAVEDA